MAEFLDTARDLYASGTTELTRAAFEHVFRAIAELQRVHSKSELDLINLESVFGAFEMARLIGSDLGSAEKSATIGEDLVSAMQRVITETLQETVLFPVQGGQIKPPSHYESFAQLLQTFIGTGTRRPAILTFNYDIALDYALQFYGLQPDYGLSEAESGGVPLLKLHGSLNWGQCPKCQRIVAAKFNVPSTAPPQPTWKWRFNLAALTCCQPLRPEPVIVPPTLDKARYHAALKLVWSKAARQLSDSSHIFICGYSLPETDSFFRYLYALGSVGDILLKRICVFDPSLAVKDRFQKLLGPGARARFEYRQEAFGHALGYIRSVLPK
jgi:hypothetical protein